MGKFRGFGKRQMNSHIQKNYWQQAVTKKEIIEIVLISTGITVITGWIYYRSFLGCVLVIPFGIWIYHCLKKERIERKKEEFLLQFKEMIQSISQALNVGYSLENAIKESQKEMSLLYHKKSLIEKEIELMVRKLRLQIPIEQVLEEFSERVDIEDVTNFTTVFTSAKKSGGDMIAIIFNTVTQIAEKIDMKREISVILAAKKYEFRIMCLIPYIMIFYMQLSFPQFTSNIYGSAMGIGVMSICLGIYIAACIMGTRIVNIEI